MIKTFAKAARVREIVREHIKDPISATIKALKKERLGRSESYIYGIRSKIRAEEESRPKHKSAPVKKTAHNVSARKRPRSIRIIEEVIEGLQTKKAFIENEIFTLEAAVEVLRRLGVS